MPDVARQARITGEDEPFLTVPPTVRRVEGGKLKR